MPLRFWRDSPEEQETIVRIVDNRTMVLGLDCLYREAMSEEESGRLLECARSVAQQLDVAPADVPIEGYYAESPQLREYFRLMRALQEQDDGAEARVKDLEAFQVLRELTNSGMYGPPKREGKLLPMGHDPLTQALERTDEWTISPLTDAAYQIATDADDWSLVGLAARTKDAFVITATRESVVLYAGLTLGTPLLAHRYEWQVDPELAAAANRFIETANRFVRRPLPRAEPKNAKAFHRACDDSYPLGRCVRIGANPPQTEHYHWAIRSTEGAGEVEEFWSPEIWTTTRYRAERLRLG